MTPKEQKFCDEYLIDLNASAAAVRAGYSERASKEIASRLLTKANIKERIAELMLEQQERTKVTADMVIKELAALGFWSINDFIDTDNTIRDISMLDKELTKPIIGLKVKETTFGEDGLSKTTELKFADKKGALVDLGRHLGIFEKDNEQTKTVMQITGMIIQ